MDRKEAVLSFWSSDRSAHCSIRYAAPKEPELRKRLVAVRGKHTPFGAGSWAHLETDVPVTLGGLELSPGIYKLAIEWAEDGAWSLLVFDSEDLRKQGATPWRTAKIAKHARRAKLGHAWSKEKAKKWSQDAQLFAAEFSAKPDEVGVATLRIHLGRRLLTAPVVVDLTRAHRITTVAKKVPSGG